MLNDDDSGLDAVDRGLARLFAEDQPVPPNFTLQVLRRIQNERWSHEVFLARVFYAGLCASGVLIIAGIGVALRTVTTLSSDAAVTMAIVGLAVSAIATWPRLRRAGLD